MFSKELQVKRSGEEVAGSSECSSPVKYYEVICDFRISKYVTM